MYCHRRTLNYNLNPVLLSQLSKRRQLLSRYKKKYEYTKITSIEKDLLPAISIVLNHSS